MKEIKTSHGIYEFQEIKFENGIKKINREIAKANLLTLKECLDKNGVSFGLMFGTLLGAIRENNFIEHDEDTDIFMLLEDRQKLLDSLFDLRDKGFEIGRYDEKLISIIKDGEYIDVYFFKKKGRNIRENSGRVIESTHLEELEKYEFLGTSFNIPKDADRLLVHLYGSDWRIPKINTSASGFGSYSKIRNFIEGNYPLLFKVISWLKAKSHT